VFELRIDVRVLIGNGASSRHRERLAHAQDNVGRWDLPAFDVLFRLGQVGGIALGHAVLDPLAKELLVGAGHVGIVGEMAVSRVRVPGRHAALSAQAVTSS
jgi:hypothetical protein